MVLPAFPNGNHASSFDSFGWGIPPDDRLAVKTVAIPAGARPTLLPLLAPPCRPCRRPLGLPRIRICPITRI
jgi:hypothetical protein